MNGDEQVNPFWSRRVQDAAVVDGLTPPTRVRERSEVYLLFLLMNGIREMKHQDRRKDFLGDGQRWGNGLKSRPSANSKAFETPSSWDPQTP